jgi:hypothetical protein
VTAYVRYSVEDRFVPVPLQPVPNERDRFRATLPPPPPRLGGQAATTGLEYYLAVEPSGGGEPLAGVGEAGQPLRMLVAFRAAPVTVVEPPPNPWYRRWWPWVIIGAVVAGGVVGGVLGARALDNGGTPVGPTQQVVIRFQ